MTHEYLKNIKPRVLCSYHYFRGQKLRSDLGRYFGELEVDVFGDSGAYSMFASGASVLVDEYAFWLKENTDLIEVYANLDVHGEYEAGDHNQRRMEELGLSPIPVYHAEFPLSVFEGYAERYPYVGVGGVAGMKANANRLMHLFVNLFKIAEQHDCGLHGFGITAQDMLLNFPWKSVDSSSWSASFRYGNVPVFHPGRNLFYSIKIGDPKSCYRMKDVIEGYGFKVEEFADKEKNDRKRTAALASLSWWKAEKFYRARHNSKLKIYLSNANRMDDWILMPEVLGHEK